MPNNVQSQKQIILTKITNNMVSRCFAHVGQALFAVERYCEHTIVFDCGGEDQDMVKRAIYDVFRDDEIIDILFISHYDRDHINGIQFLLKNHTVRHIVLPMIEEPTKAIMAHGMLDAGDNDGAHFVLNPVQLVSNFVQRNRLDGYDSDYPKVHYVQPWTEETNRGLRDVGEEGYPRVSDIDEIGEYIAAGVALTINRKTRWCEQVCQKPNPKCPCRWIYLPFNRQVMTSDQVQAFWRELGMPENSKCDDVLPGWEDVRKQIKSAWSTATGLRKSDINDYSMTLYSGCRFPLHFNACLFTGDYNARSYMTELRTAYKILWDNIRVIQIPHHGSQNNFHKDLIIHHGVHVISNRNQPKNNRQVNDTAVINKILSRGEYVAKTSHQNFYTPNEDYYWDDRYRLDYCEYCEQCR